MGAGASIQGGEIPEKDIHLHHGRYESGRVANSTRTATNKSVRAMALMNHSRHENGYISADSISLALAGKTRAQGKSDVEYPPDYKHHHDAKHDLSVSLGGNGVGNNITTISEAPNEVASEKIAPPPIVTPGGSGGMGLFRSQLGLGLKLHVDDDAEWGHVSDDENDHDNVDPSKFDDRLLEIPKDHSNSNLANNKSGVFEPLKLEGMRAGLAEDGIVRSVHMRGEKPRMRKLPMRERLTILCKLGAGASSAVYKALDLTDMRLVALKTIQVRELGKRLQMIREFSALFQLLREYSRRESSHMPQATAARPEKYIVSFYDAFHNQEDGVVCLMIEYMDGGSLQEIVDAGGCDDESTLANIAVQALKGLNFLHNCNQIHRDLKPGNFLISHRGEVKVADLGIMKQLPPDTIAPNGQRTLARTNTFVGTATYMSPERIDGKEYSYPSDVWAFGLSILTLALGKLPIDTSGGYWTILQSIRDAPSPAAPDTFSPEFRDFINSCLKKNPDDRANCKELLKHRFLKKACPEDLTYGQNDERGKEELKSTVRAIKAHVESLKQDVRQRYANEQEYLTEAATPLHEKLFGNLWSDDLMTVLRRLLLSAKPSDKDLDDGGANGEAKRERRFTRPRLLQLARQLHLSLDKVTREVTLMLDAMEVEMANDNNNGNSTQSQEATSPSSPIPGENA